MDTVAGGKRVWCPLELRLRGRIDVQSEWKRAAVRALKEVFLGVSGGRDYSAKVRSGARCVCVGGQAAEESRLRLFH